MVFVCAYFFLEIAKPLNAKQQIKITWNSLAEQKV